MDDETPQPFPYRHQLLSMINAWASGEPNRFHAVTMQVAASIARRGDSETAQRMRDTINRALRYGSHMPKYSGAKTFCAKCESVRISIKYMRENGIEFIERECAQCGHQWYERCADAS